MDNLGMWANLLYTNIKNRPNRNVAFGGIAGAGKTTLAMIAAGTEPILQAEPDFAPHPPIAIINHADGIKEDVLQWVSMARSRHLIPGEEATFDTFCDFLGISKPIVKQDLWPILSNVWESFDNLLSRVYDELPNLAGWTRYQTGENIEAKVLFVEHHKHLFRSPCQVYGQALKDLDANPYFWAEQTVARAHNHHPCLNADTRFTDEVQLLHQHGWVSVFLEIDEATQKKRRPDLTDEQRAHISEHGLDPKDCTYVVDATQPLSYVVRDVFIALGGI